MITRQECIRLNVAGVRDGGLRLILEKHALELTRCVECDELGLGHESGCSVSDRVEDLIEWLDEPEGDKPWELGTLVYMTKGPDVPEEEAIPEPYWDEERKELVSYCRSNRDTPLRRLIQAVIQHVNSDHDQMGELQAVLLTADAQAIVKVVRQHVESGHDQMDELKKALGELGADA